MPVVSDRVIKGQRQKTIFTRITSKTTIGFYNKHMLSTKSLLPKVLLWMQNKELY